MRTVRPSGVRKVETWSPKASAGRCGSPPASSRDLAIANTVSSICWRTTGLVVREMASRKAARVATENGWCCSALRGRVGSIGGSPSEKLALICREFAQCGASGHAGPRMAHAPQDDVDQGDYSPLLVRRRQIDGHTVGGRLQEALGLDARGLAHPHGRVVRVALRPPEPAVKHVCNKVPRPGVRHGAQERVPFRRGRECSTRDAAQQADLLHHILAGHYPGRMLELEREARQQRLSVARAFAGGSRRSCVPRSSSTGKCASAGPVSRTCSRLNAASCHGMHV